VLGASAHQDVPFERLVDVLQPERDMSRNPLFQVMFLLQNETTEGIAIPGLSASPLYADTGTAKFDFTLSATESPFGLDVSFDYAPGLLDRPTLLRFAARWREMLGARAEEPELRLSAIPAASAAERHQLVSEWNDTALAAEPQTLRLEQLFEA